MIKTFTISAGCLVLGLMNLSAQGGPNPVPANDNPMSGLKLDSGPASNLFADKFKGHLVVMDNGSAKPFDATTLSGVKYWAFYYSASWCPPCRAFTPKLVDFYKTFKQTHPNFELIFVDDDQDEDSMLNYMKTDGMTWPAVKFDDLENAKLNARKYCGSGIPDLVLTDVNGKVLSDSFDGENYLGPMKVLEDIKKLVPTPDAAKK